MQDRPSVAARDSLGHASPRSSIDLNRDSPQSSHVSHDLAE